MLTAYVVADSILGSRCFVFSHGERGLVQVLVIKKEVLTMAKKSSPSPAVVKAVQTSLPVVAPATEPKVRGEKKFTTEQYLKEYMAEHAAGGTWASLCERTGFVLNNARQAITTLRSEYRETIEAKVAVCDAKMLATILKNTGKKTAEEYVAYVVELKFPFLQEGARNTQKAKIRQSWENETLPGM